MVKFATGRLDRDHTVRFRFTGPPNASTGFDGRLKQEGDRIRETRSTDPATLMFSI